MININKNEIIKYWNSEKPIVAIICTTYNHEAFIAKCLDGFISQKTNFPFKIIVHDDCSNDKTIDIINEYKNSFPNIVCVILEKQNQYSIDSNIITKKIIKEIDSSIKYLSFCDGDDYWCDDSKLQKQFDFMENNENYSACSHNTKYVNLDNSDVNQVLNKNCVNCDYSLRDILTKHGYLFHYSSFFCKKDYFINMPSIMNIKQISDYQLFINCAINGNIRYTNTISSAYRINNDNSWTGVNKKKLNNVFDVQISIIKMLLRLNKYTNYHYFIDIIFGIIRNIKVILFAIYDASIGKIGN